LAIANPPYELELKLIRVNDILNNPSQLEIVLVLESPFKKEISHKHPLAGNSGISVTNHIKQFVNPTSPVFNFTKDLGCELKQSSFTKLGIVNVSKYPLDKQCYLTVNKTISAFDLIRRNPKTKFKKRKNAYSNTIEKALLKNFTIRINRIFTANPTVIFVPCGYLADKFLSACNLPSKNLINRIPHPSYNQWNNSRFNLRIFNTALQNYL
jgi:hypothetical protein